VKFTNVRELKTKTSEMLRTVERGNTVLVTTHGQPTAMLVPVTEDDIEDALLAYSPKLRKKIEGGLKDIRASRSMPLSDYKAKRGKKKAPPRDPASTSRISLVKGLSDGLLTSPARGNAESAFVLRARQEGGKRSANEGSASCGG
jgi:prevent-host-death family protein